MIIALLWKITFSHYYYYFNIVKKKGKKKKIVDMKKKKKQGMFPARLELATFRVLGGRDNHYTTETSTHLRIIILIYKYYLQSTVLL